MEKEKELKLERTTISSRPIHTELEITLTDIEGYVERPFSKEENLEPGPECCINRVPKAIRKINKEAYTPQLISIGPLHFQKSELAEKSKIKIKYKRDFSQRITPEIWQKLITFIQNHEQSIRSCYEETSKLPKLKYISMILYDAVFIIELFLKTILSADVSASSYAQRLRNDIWLDLLMLENQLPYCVLEELYTIAFPNQNIPFLYLSCRFFYGVIYNGEQDILTHVDVRIKHFTDLKRHMVTKPYSRPQSIGSAPDIPCAIKLQESGVKFKKFEEKVEEKCLLDVRFEKKKRCLPWLKVHELLIPHFPIDDQTETMFRNLMALEQCHYPSETYICNYVNLIDALINNEEDVNLLAEAGIIAIHVGDSAKVANMFNKLEDQIILDDYCYIDLFKDLKVHYNSPWNHAVATLKRVYFNNLWRGTGTIAAIFLLVFTLIQTICSVFQVV